MKTEFPSKVVYSIGVLLNWSTFIEGQGYSPTEARRNCMAKALSKLKDPSLRRFEQALNEEVK